MARVKSDEHNTLFVIGLPDGAVKKAVSVFYVKDMITRLKIKITVPDQAGKPLTAKEIVALLSQEEDSLKAMIDPTKEV